MDMLRAMSAPGVNDQETQFMQVQCRCWVTAVNCWTLFAKSVAYALRSQSPVVLVH